MNNDGTCVKKRPILKVLKIIAIILAVIPVLLAGTAAWTYFSLGSSVSNIKKPDEAGQLYLVDYTGNLNNPILKTYPSLVSNIGCSTFTAKIENDHVTLPETETISDGEYYYEKQGDRVITYMKDVDMYLAVTNTQSEFGSILPYLKMPIICALAGILIAVGLMICAERVRRKET